MGFPTRLLIVTLTGSALAAAAVLSVGMASGGSQSVPPQQHRLLIGFQDDPALRWDADRSAMLDRARAANARIVRTFIDWSRTAPTRPARPADPFDPAYRLNDVDELVRGAQLRGMSTLITIWGTPGWANGNAGPNRLPTRLADLRTFARAIAARYSGRYPGYPLVGYWSVWNEPNLQQFLSPQFDARGTIVSPALYARLYRSAFAGIKAGNPSALVAIGETSPLGRDHVYLGPSQQTTSPGTFARLLALQRPRLSFDAWAHHPYPTSLGLPPTQQVRWPNVSLKALPRFQAALDTWFGRKGIPIWITEYGYQTRRPQTLGVTTAQQATYGVQALRLAAAERHVEMFIWFVLRDSLTTPWRSGLFNLAGKEKPAFARFGAAAAALDASNAVVTAASGNRPVKLPVEVLTLVARNGAGTAVGITWRAYLGSRLVAVRQTRLALPPSGRLLLPVSFERAQGKTYRVEVNVNDIHGQTVDRTLQVVTG